MNIDFSGKTVIITGAKRGVGKSCALLFAESGANLVLNSLTIEESDDVVAACRALSAKTLVVKGDVRLEEDVRRIFSSACKQFGKVDILVNNAGGMKDRAVTKMSVDDFKYVIDINLTNTFLCSREAFRIMKEQAVPGSIVNISSLSGFKGNVGQANYSSAKAGITGLTKVLALEGATSGIRVNAVAPGFVETDMTSAVPDAAKNAIIGRIALSRLGTPLDIAKAVLFLASELSSYITGQTIHVNGGSYMY